MKYSALQQFLPTKFLYVIPLYIGVELILSFAILNKIGGAYGVLSILTGHHMNFWQWLYNLLAFLVLPFYISALFSLSDKSTNVRRTCLSCLIYLIDTVVGFIYTLYFLYFWFSREDNGPASSGSPQISVPMAKRVVDTSQSASPGRELFFMVSGLFITTFARVYFCFVMLSFTKLLLIQSTRNQRNHGHDSVSEEAVHQSVFGKVKKMVRALEMRAKMYFTEAFESTASFQ